VLLLCQLAGITVFTGSVAGARYWHLTDALQPLCAAHLLRHLKDLFDFERGQQDWAQQ
jgi:hypothetical protein